LRRSLKEKSRGWIVAFLCAGPAAALPIAQVRSAPSETGEMQLGGSWHLTIHYKDAASENPEAERWDDKLWRFEPLGSRMQWTEFPVVVFEDREGRFEPASEERVVRTLRFWEPNEAQLAEIRQGLRVDPRGARSKGLRGDATRGFQSVGGLRAESAAVIGYAESWSVEGLPERPVFTQDVVMGSGRTEGLEGRTRYSGVAVSEDGTLVRGSFERDGTRRGTFVLRRSGAPVLIGGPESDSKKKPAR
jgi:hypothetical protein